MADEKLAEAPKVPAEKSAPAEPLMTVRAYAEMKKLRPWQVILLRRLGLEKVMAPGAIAAELDKLAKERI
jgi:hypothetical protein